MHEYPAPEGKTINQNPYSATNKGGYKTDWDLGAAGSENNFRVSFVPNEDGDVVAV